MAVWRTKAYELFNLRAGDYSFREGKRVLFADLVDWARTAVLDDNKEMLRRIAAYITWATQQNSDDLASVVDLPFFKYVFEDDELCTHLKPYFPEHLFDEKRHILESPADD